MLHALYELLRGFQAAHDASGASCCAHPLAEHPDEVYRALLTVILRLVFLLYAEERDMLPEDETFLRYYSLAGLYERLREDAARFPDTMDQRYGAWAQLLALFRHRLRRRHGGAPAGAPRRLFDPDRYPFLEGRPAAAGRAERIEPPLVPDGTVHRVLEKLLVLDGERLSYRALDVEQIGSVYETMMGFELETGARPSVAISAEAAGAPTAVDLDAVARGRGAAACKWVKDSADSASSRRRGAAVKEAVTVDGAARGPRAVIDWPRRPMWSRRRDVLQPSEERRRSGSHYTPRSLTEPIVRTTLRPILEVRGDGRHAPEQILDLKVCDPAMGSGAFLVEACRQLGDALVEAWDAHGEVPADSSRRGRVTTRAPARRPALPLRRGPEPVRRRPRQAVAVARDARRDHPLTFLDHALRRGDSLVGLIAAPDRVVPLGSSGAQASRGFDIGRTSSGSLSSAGRSARLTRRRRTGRSATCGMKLRRSSTGASLRRPCGGRVFRGRRTQGARSEGSSSRTQSRRGPRGSTSWLDELRHAEQTARAVPLGGRVS